MRVMGLLMDLAEMIEFRSVSMAFSQKCMSLSMRVARCVFSMSTQRRERNLCWRLAVSVSILILSRGVCSLPECWYTARCMTLTQVWVVRSSSERENVDMMSSSWFSITNARQKLRLKISASLMTDDMWRVGEWVRWLFLKGVF